MVGNSGNLSTQGNNEAPALDNDGVAAFHNHGKNVADTAIAAGGEGRTPWQHQLCVASDTPTAEVIPLQTDRNSLQW